MSLCFFDKRWCTLLHWFVDKGFFESRSILHCPAFELIGVDWHWARSFVSTHQNRSITPGLSHWLAFCIFQSVAQAPRVQDYKHKCPRLQTGAGRMKDICDTITHCVPWTSTYTHTLLSRLVSFSTATFRVTLWIAAFVLIHGLYRLTDLFRVDAMPSGRWRLTQSQPHAHGQ